MKNPTSRFTALDVLRGITVCFMIIVNTPGNYETTYAALKHAQWHGFTPTDLVFPTFLFVVGNALSFAERKWQGMSDGRVIWIISKRALIIFILGLLMYWFPFVHWNDGHLEGNPISHTRIMGVLQRIALGYFFAALMVRYFKTSTIIRMSVIFLLLYWLILLVFAGGDDPFDMLSNAGNRLDLWLFGSSHLYHGEGVAFDPEGVLSTLPAIANVTFGYVAGKWIQQKGKTFEGLTRLLLIGALLIGLALLWNISFPINKKLWTGSFVLLTVGIDCVVIAGLIYIIEFQKINRWTHFFEVFGKNPLSIYLLSELGATLLWFFRIGGSREPLYTWLYNNVFVYAGNYFGSFLFAVAIMLTCWLVGYVMDRRRIYIRV
jgi:predicted acyltransferase